MGLNVFVFPLLLQYSCFQHSLHCVHCAIHFHIGDQGLFLVFSLMFFVRLATRVIQKAPEGSVVLKASALWALPRYFLAAGGLGLFTHMQTCLNGFKS